MPTLNFPSSPALNDSYAFGGKTWVYNGAAWALQTTSLTTTAVTEGTNLYFTNARSRAAISVAGAGSYDNSTGVITITGGVTSVGGATGAVSNAQLASGITSSGVLTTGNVAEGANLYFTTSRARASIDAAANGGITYSSATGNVSLSASGVTANTYGGASKVPVFTVDSSGRITSAANVNVAGVSSFGASGNTFTIGTADGGTFSASIQLDSVRLGTDTTGDYVATMTAGNGITVGTATGEGSTPVITNTGVLSVNGQTGNATGFATTANSLAQFAATSSAELAGVISDETGSGALVFATSPTLVTPALGTPASGVMTNVTGLPISTGVSGLGAGVATFLATPSSANLASAVTDETGSGSLVFSSSPVLLTPNIGTPSYAVLTSATGLPISTGVSGLGAGIATFLATPSSVNLASAVTDETGTGNILFSNSPVMVTPNLGTPSAVTLTNATGLPLTTGVTGTLPVANGGTGVTSSTGTGNVVLSTSPVLTTPNLGTPSAAVLTNATGLPISSGVSGLGSGVATFLGQTPTSANLATLITDETGSGALVFATSPTLVTPILGTPQSVTLTNATGLPISTGVSGLGSGVASFLATPTSANFATVITDETGTGNVVLSTNPVLVTPNLGTPSAATLTNATGLPVSTGISGLGTGIATFLGQEPTSANLRTLITDETGTGVLVFGTSPAITTSLTTPSGSFDLVNTGATTVNFAGAGTTVNIGAVTGNTNIRNNMVIAGNLLVQGTTTTVSSTTLDVADKNLTLAKGAADSATADGAGITIDGANATLNYVHATTAFTSSQDVDLASGKVFKVNNGQVLSATGLGPNVVNSNLTSVGTISSGTWQGSSISTTYTAAKVTAVNSRTGAVTGLAETANGLSQFAATTSAELAGVISDETGSGALVFATSPTLVTPNLGTPSAVTLTSATGLPISTGVSGLGTGVATFLGQTPTSANLATLITDETGSGALVFATSPTLVTPALGTPTSGVMTNVTGLPISTGVSGLGTGVATFLATPSSANLASALTDESGSSTVAFTNSPTLITPNIGTPSYAVLTNATGLPIINGTTGTLSVARGGTGVTTSTGTGNVVLSTSPVLTTPDLGTPSAATLTNATGLPISSGVSGLGANIATFLATPTSANFAFAVTDETGSGNVVLSNNPVLVTPNIGTPSAGVLTNATGLPISTGVSGLGTNVATFLATPSSSNLASAVTDETGSGALVFATSPTLVTPALGTPSSATLTNATGLPVSTGIAGLGANQTTLLAANAMSGVAATTYGSTLNIPVITVDVYGRITSAANVAITSGVSSVGGATGAVSNAQLASSITSSGVLTTANVAEVTNLYFTNARSRQAITAGSGITYDSANGIISGSGTYTDANARAALSITGTKGSYNNSTGVFDLANIANVTVSANAPGSPNIGDVWIDEDDGKSYLYFNDGSSNQWVEQASGTIVSSLVESVGGSTGIISNAMIATALTGLNINVGNLTPTGNLIQSLGSPTNQFKDLYLSNSTIFLGSLQLKDTGGALTVTASGGGGAVNFARTTDKLSVFAATSSSELSGVISDETGSGSLVFATSPTLVTPALGTPASGVMTNVTGLPISTGVSGLGSGVATFLATPSSANLASAITDETGSGALVFGTSPAITTSLTTPSASFDLINTTATTVNFAKAATALSIGAATGTTTVNNNMTVTGNLTVSGTTTTVSSATLEVTDKNITVAKGAANSAAADGAGITVDGASATFNYVHATTAWTSSQDLNLLTGKVFEINDTQVLSGSGLGSGILASNLTSVGTISSGTWNGTVIAGLYGGTGVANSGKTITLGGNFTTSGAFATTLTATATTGVTLPTTGTLATLAGSETFTNKTLTTPIISSISNTGTLTLPTSTDTLVGRATTDTLTNKTLTSPTLTAPALGTPASGVMTNVTGLPLTTGVTGTLPVANGGTGVTTSTGTTNVVLSNSPTLVTPALGTPSSGTLTSCTGLPLTTGITGTLPVANGGTGITSLGTGVATLLGTPSSANLAAAITDETGSGALVFATSPTLVTPALGTPSSGNLASCTFPTLNQNTTGSAASLSAILAVASGGTGTATPATVAGTGISVSGSFPNQTITNTGATSIVAGTNISVSGATGAVTVSVSGTVAAATNATNSAITNDTTTNASYYPTFVSTTTGNLPLNVSSTKLFFNPSTGLLTSTDYNSASDKRLKKNIKTVKSALDTVDALRGVSFEWKEGGSKAIGLIAQEVKEVLPEVVTTDDNGYMGIKYTNIVGVLVEAIKELKAEFEAYKKTHP